MSNYSALDAMGIRNPEQIERFATYMSDRTDILRITYNRKPGSMLPVTRKYRFPQLKKSTMVDSGTRKTEVIFQSSAEFRNAVAELEQLMDAHSSVDEIRKLILAEMAALEEEVAAHMDSIRSLIKKI